MEPRQFAQYFLIEWLFFYEDIFSSSESMFVERKVRYSALFTNLVGCHPGAISFLLSDIILAQLACPLSDDMFWLHSGRTNLSLYKHWSECGFIE
jgi:hypothetical protein